MIIYCCNCEKDIDARLTDGSEIYPHRRDLHSLPFWKCDNCDGKVGCHHKTKNRTRPLGVIPTAEISKIRGKIHGIIDPLWRSGGTDRKTIYSEMSSMLGYKFHSAEIRCETEAGICLDTAVSVNDKFKGSL